MSPYFFGRPLPTNQLSPSYCVYIHLQSTGDGQHVSGDAVDDPILLSIQTAPHDVLKHLFQLFKTALQAGSGGTHPCWTHQVHHAFGAVPGFCFGIGEFIRSLQES